MCKRAAAKEVAMFKLMLDYLEPQLCEWILLCSKGALETVKNIFEIMVLWIFYILFLQEKAFENLFLHLYWQPHLLTLEVDGSSNLRISQTESPCLGIQFYSWAILMLPSLRSWTSLQSWWCRSKDAEILRRWSTRGPWCSLTKRLWCWSTRKPRCWSTRSLWCWSTGRQSWKTS